MPTLDEIARFQTALTSDDVAWLHALARDWQILADLSFSDLVLWVPDAETKGLWAAAQIRPTTGPTTMLEDVADRSYERYLESFTYPIPERFERDNSFSSDSGG